MPSEDQTSTSAPVATPSWPRLRFWVELFFLATVCGAVFFPALGQHDFIKTEGLRAIVVAEMRERPGITLPTVHHRPYLNKPPLYAWTTTALSRAVGRFDEGIARLPSAISATLLVLLLYWAAERWIGRGAGFAAGVLTLANATVLDYGVRAELDMGFTFLTTLAILLAWPALRCSGTRSNLAWLGVYAATLLAAMWKGPHSLIFLWVLLLFYGYTKRDWRWLRNPGQWAGLAIVLGALVGWSLLLSMHAGAGNVGRTAGIELFARLVPYRLKHWLSIAWFVPTLVVITIPASIFVIAGLRNGVVVDYGDTNQPRTRGLIWQRTQTWWRAVWAEPFAAFLLCWIVPNAMFLAIAPAKAPRYTLPLFPPILLLAAWALHRAQVGRATGQGPDHVTGAWRCVYGVVGVVGVAILITGMVLAVTPDAMPRALAQSSPLAWLIAGAACLTAALPEFLARRGHRPLRRLLGLVIVVLGAQIVVKNAWWPLRVASDSQREAANAIANHLAPNEPVFVLGDHEFFDTAYYCPNAFYWITSPPEAAQHWPEQTGHFLLRKKDVPEVLPGSAGMYEPVYEFERDDKACVLLAGPIPNTQP